MKRALLFFIDLYRTLLSPALHTLVPVRTGCRFSPTCSEYCRASIEEQGVRIGLRQGLHRLLRCHPWYKV